MALTNGNYVVNSWKWNNKRGAVTWGNGQTGVAGTIDQTNSLVGKLPGDKLGLGGVFRYTDAAFHIDTNYYFNGLSALGNGNYTVAATSWNGNNGAVAWGNGKSGTTGIVDGTNGLIGVSNAYNPSGNASYLTSVLPAATQQVSAYDGTSVNYNYYGNSGSNQYSSGGLVNVFLKNLSGYYIIQGIDSISKKQTITWGNGTGGTSGVATICNSVFGNPVDSYNAKRYAFDSIYNYLLVCRSDENIVTRFYPALGAATPTNNDNSTGTISGNSQFVFPTSTGCGQIAALMPSGTNPVSGSVTAKTWLESPPLANFVARHYEITPSINPGTSTGTVTLYFTQSDFDGFNDQNPAPTAKLPTGPTDAVGIANLLVQKESGVSNVGTGLPGTYPGPITTIDPVDGNIIWNTSLNRWEVSFDVIGFSGFFVKTTPFTALPLRLLSFSGKHQADNNYLEWKTAEEINTKTFVLESSVNGRSFQYTGTVLANGGGNYFFDDTHPLANRTYYRLQIVDSDGRFKYSNIISINSIENSTVSLYPNPVITATTLNIGNRNSLIGTQAELTEASGKLLQLYRISTNQQQLDMRSFPAGLYFLKLNDGNVIKILKQ